MKNNGILIFVLGLLMGVVLLLGWDLRYSRSELQRVKEHGLEYNVDLLRERIKDLHNGNIVIFMDGRTEFRPYGVKK